MNNFKSLIEREVKNAKIYRTCKHEYKFDHICSLHGIPSVKYRVFICEKCGMNDLREIES